MNALNWSSSDQWRCQWGGGGGGGHKLSLLSECVYMKLSFTVSILVCKSLNGKNCQYSNNTFQKRQKSFIYSFAKLNSQTCKGPHGPDAIRQRDANFQFSTEK